MKIKNITQDHNLDVCLNLIDDLVKEAIITDKASQVLGVTDDEVSLSEVYPSQELSDILTAYPEFKIITDPSETNAFKPEEGLPDVNKVGTVQDPTYEDNEQSPELFPDTEVSDTIIKNFNKVNTMSKNRKNFDKVDENGVAIDEKQAAVESTERKDDANYNPAEGEFSSADVEPFNQEEIDKANDVGVNMDGNSEVKVFSEEEIDEMTDSEEIEETAKTMEEEEQTFSVGKKRLFAAKRRLHRINSKFAERKSFAEELSDKEQSDVIEDIVAILQDAPEIRDAVAEEVEELQGTETPAKDSTEEVFNEDIAPSVIEDEDEADTESIETMAFSDDEIAEVEDEVADIPSEEEVTEQVEETDEAADDPDMTSDNEEEVEEEVEESEDEYKDDEEDENGVTEAGNLFVKSFSSDSVSSFKRSQLAKMAERTPGRTRF